jgi:hypothetical protein
MQVGTVLIVSLIVGQVLALLYIVYIATQTHKLRKLLAEEIKAHSKALLDLYRSKESETAAWRELKRVRTTLTGDNK